uniref:Uncharacterized protein n=1 Tax=Vespula pensylvanica TaxID=30213 RepID=A0A834P2K1_VESPE|nr:hypothetical protein H0235_007752 [Vespula pensylvanica]
MDRVLERSRPFQTRKHEFCVLLSRSFLRSFESTSHRTEVLRIVITKVYLWDSGVTETVYYVSSSKNPRCLFLESDAEMLDWESFRKTVHQRLPKKASSVGFDRARAASCLVSLGLAATDTGRGWSRLRHVRAATNTIEKKIEKEGEEEYRSRCLRDDTVSALSLQSRPLRSHRVKCAIILVNSEQLAVIKHRKPSQVADNDTPDVLSKSSAPANDFDIAVCVGDSCLRIGGKPSSFELGNGGWKGEKGEKVHAYGTYRVYGMTVELYKDEKLMPWWAAERQARIGFCPNPQSLRALMTARHDPPGKILAIMEHATSNMQLKPSKVNGTGSRTDPRDSKRSILEARVKTDSRDVFNETLGPSCVSLVSFREKDRGQSVCTCSMYELPQQVPLCLFRGNMCVHPSPRLL